MRKRGKRILATMIATMMVTSLYQTTFAEKRADGIYEVD